MTYLCTDVPGPVIDAVAQQHEDDVYDTKARKRLITAVGWHYVIALQVGK